MEAMLQLFRAQLLPKAMVEVILVKDQSVTTVQEASTMYYLCTELVKSTEPSTCQDSLEMLQM